MGRQTERRPNDLAGDLVGDDLVARLAQIMRRSLLPGEPSHSDEQLREAGAFVLDTARHRAPGSVGLSLASDEHRHTRIAIVNDDMPFLVDSISATIAAHGLEIDQLLHPVIAVTRDGEGNLVAIGKGETRESLIYIETDRVDARARRALERSLRETLEDVRAAVQDWGAMQEALAADSQSVADAEIASLLDWFHDGMLTQLGHFECSRSGHKTSTLGICREAQNRLISLDSIRRAVAFFETNPSCEFLAIKSNSISRVHRPVPPDLFIIPRRKGARVASLSVHAGLWTSAALAAPPSQVPILRRRLERLMKKLSFDPKGHAGKALVHAMTALPHDLLIGLEAGQVERLATTMMSLVDRPRVKLALATPPLKRHIFAFVWLQRDMLSTAIREQIQALLTEAEGIELLDWSLEVEDRNLAMIRFALDIRKARNLPQEAALEARLQDLLRGWTEAVERELAHYEEPARASALASRFAPAFPPGYRANYGASEAAIDIFRLRALSLGERHQRDARLYRLASDPPEQLRMKIYQRAAVLHLSDAVPVLENFGFTVLSEIPTPLDETRIGTIHDFTLALAQGTSAAPLLDRSEAIERAIADVLNARAENDPFNRLIASVGLSADEANWMRAFYRYLRQVGSSFTIYTVVDALAAAAPITRALVALFRALHQPDFAGDREPAADDARAAIRRALTKVAAVNDDRLLRLYLALIEAIVRTNAFAPAGREALAFKIDSSRVPGLPKPLPWREIWVYSRRLEGVHLRAGPIARGGIRWSDRRDDFRTEILGLMKAQRVKNAVIVPSGAKGGFYPKQLPSPVENREAWAAEGQASYEIFIRSLLSLTDNLVDGEVVHPSDVVVRDGDDPYLVVAADKGTARFSDIANRIAREHNFWLDDAFASGGSHGYDHKAMGITARGAWVSVQRHFLEMGIDVQTEPVRVVGCGDMSGDVFGNGMLLSKAIKLVAAFDHRHIFIDPDPDPKTSWAERKRLFEMERSSWNDYNRDRISAGGGVFPRDAKRIRLSKRARAALGIEQAELEPEELIRAILKSPVDLIWFGGIGTYIKAASENNAEVGDPSNDALRVDAEELRARVIGEGANLAVTQAGRIAFALRGGRINTDFIDNSAGVDCSDNEVNIKIALADARRSRRLSEKRRIALLESMTDEVAQIVLEDNRLQALALSIAEAASAETTASHLRLIEALEESGNLDRRTEGLADDQTLQRRAADGRGLTRPELAVLLASAKLVLQSALEQSALPDDPVLETTLFESFPQPMRTRFKAQIARHRLRREIIATKLSNRMVNRIGLIHAFELAEEEGAGLAQVAAAFVLVEELFNLRSLWRELDLAPMPENVRPLLFDRLGAAVGNLMSDALRSYAGHIQPHTIIADIARKVAQLDQAADQLLSRESSARSARFCESLIEAGAPDTLAAKVAHMFDLDGSIGIARLAHIGGIEPLALTRAFIAIGEEIGIDWAQRTAAMMTPADVWERLLVDGLARDFQQMRLEFLGRQLRRKAGRANPGEAVAEWARTNSQSVQRFRAMVTRARAQSPVTPAVLAQIASQARNLLER